MLVSLIIPSKLTPITVWKELSPLVFIRGCVWLLGLSILPGLYFLRLTKIANRLTNIGKIAVGANLSFVVVGLVTLILYYCQGTITPLPWLLLSLLLILGSTYWVKSFESNRKNVSTVAFKLSKWGLVLTIAMVGTILIAFSVQLGQRYLIPGDNWRSLEAAVEIISQRNVYESFIERSVQYPVMFGFILAGLSVCAGLPVVNAYVLLFPLVALNVVSFLVLLRVVFNQDEKIAVLSSIIYGFGGGLGWLIQTLVYSGEKSFWTLGLLTQDIYFSMSFWNSIEFFYKSLALTLAYASLTTFVIGTKLEKRSTKIFSLTVSSLLMLFSFFIHMLEPIVFLPLIFPAAYVYQKGRDRYLSLGAFLIVSVLMAYAVDFLTSGFYFSLTTLKIAGTLLTTLKTEKVLLYSFLTVAAISMMIPVYLFSKRLSRLVGLRRYLRTVKPLTVVALITVYLGGLRFFGYPPPFGVSDPFPRYLYVTRYGFIGLLAIIGAGLARWRESWFKIASFWGILVILMSELWWGCRMNGYLFPLLALLAGLALERIWREAKNPIYVTIARSTNSFRKFLKLNLKPMAATLIVIVLSLSFTSVVYGAYYYSLCSPPLSDDEARAFMWINENVPENDTVLAPKIYTTYTGVERISDHEIYLIDDLPASTGALIETLDNYTIRYAVVSEDQHQASPPLTVLLSYSTLVFESGDVEIFRLPIFSSPSREYSVAVLDREVLGFLGNPGDFGWLDDSFAEGWTYRNVNASSDGEVLSFECQLHKLYESEPSADKTIPPIDTNRHPYLIIKYRNTAESMPVTQIITLVNETGYPEGFIKNFYPPVSKEDTFQIFMAKLPENQTVARIGIWMRNWQNLTGKVSLQVDYIGFASEEAIPEPYSRLRFLTMAIPALWPVNYSVFSNFHEVANASILVSTYDRSVLKHLGEARSVHTFVFLNLTANPPSWGTGWHDLSPAIISGYLDGRKVIVIGIESSPYEEIHKMSEIIYKESGSLDGS